MPVAPWELAAALLVTAAAAGMQGTVGFGFALVCVPILSLIDPVLAPVPQLLLVVPLSVTVAWRERRDADLRAVPWITAGRIPGAVIGILLLGAFDTRTLGVAIALMVLIAVAIASTGSTVPMNPFTSVVAGVVSGTMGLVASIGGPPLALMYRSATGPTVRASLGVVFAIGVTISITARAVAGEMTLVDLEVAVFLLPALGVGLWIGRRLAPRVDGPALRRAILVISGTAGAALLIQNLI